MAVEEINKPAGVACNKIAGCGGCGIYVNRPESCRDFSCMWLRDDIGRVFRNMERPDHVGVIFDVTLAASPLAEAIGTHALVARQTRPGAFQEDKARKMIERLACCNVVILVKEEHMRDLMGPPGLIWKANAFLASKKGGKNNET